MLCLLIWAISEIPSDLEVPNWIEPFSASMNVYYCLLPIIFICFGTSLCIHVFKKYSINYTFIFEIDAKTSQVSQFTMLRLSLGLLFIWMFFLCL
jgi:hypothetical protein